MAEILFAIKLDQLQLQMNKINTSFNRIELNQTTNWMVEEKINEIIINWAQCTVW